MKDEALVQKVEGAFAEVVVESKEGCHACAARAFCSFNEKGLATLRVLNPMDAQPGDLVEIEVPATAYSRHFIFMFALLLLFSFSGAGLGTWLSHPLNLSPGAGGVLGFFTGLIVAGLIIWKAWRRPGHNLYPMITAIIQGGGPHG